MAKYIMAIIALIVLTNTNTNAYEYKVISHSQQALTIKLSTYLTKGTDASCYAFKRVIDKLFTMTDTIIIKNPEWVPFKSRTIHKATWEAHWSNQPQGEE